MSEAEKMYYEYGGCSCHTMPPCSFCMSMDDDEATAYWNGGHLAVEKLWRDQGQAEVEESQWVVIFDYEK